MPPLDSSNFPDDLIPVPSKAATPSSFPDDLIPVAKPVKSQAALPDDLVPPPTAKGAFVRGAVRGAIPAAGGLAGFGAGAEIGAAAGAPLAPFTFGLSEPVGALAGGVAGAMGGGWLADKAQELILKHLPDWAVKALGQLPEQQRADIVNHPIASFVGELTPNAAFFSPFAAERAAAPYAKSVVERLMEHPATKRLVPAGVMAGQEAGVEYAQGEPLSPEKIAISGLAGAAMQRPRTLGEHIVAAGASPVRRLRGATPPSGAAPPEAFPEDIVPPPSAPSTARREPPPPRATQEPAPGLDAEKLRSFGLTQHPDGTWRTGDGSAVWDRNGNPLNRTAETWAPPAAAQTTLTMEPDIGGAPAAPAVRGEPPAPTLPEAPAARPAEPPVAAAQSEIAPLAKEEMTPRQLIEAAESSLWTDAFGDPIPGRPGGLLQPGATDAQYEDISPPPRLGSATQPERVVGNKPASPAPTEAARTFPNRMPRSAIREDTAFVPSTGAAIPVELAVVEARDLIPSHNEDLSPNPSFPQALQPRSRERAETEAQINAILNGDPSDPAATFRPELLGENPDAANGAPIVGWEGYVESGNARTIALRRAYSRNLPQAERYREYLRAQGYPVEGMREPVLVRINRAELTMPAREQLARDLNIAPQAAMSATDRAMADAAQIPPDLLRLYGGGDIFSAANQPFWRSILARIAKPAELPALTDPEGGVSPAGQTRLRNAVLAKAYGDPQFVAALTEDADSNIKAIGGALTDAAPRWAQLRQAVAEGRIEPSYDLTSPVIEAVRMIRFARDNKRNVAEFMRQRGLFGDGVSPETEGVLSWFLGAPDWTRRYSRDKMSAALGEYAASAMREPGMLGTAQLSPQELIENARQRAQGAAGDLFSTGLAEPAGAGIVRRGAGEDRPGDEGLSASEARDAAQKGGGEESVVAPKGWESVEGGPQYETRPAISTTEEAQAFASDYPIGPEGTHQAAADYVAAQGLLTGHEYFAAVDHETDGIAHAGTSEARDSIRFDDALRARIWDAAETPLAIHHNHPNNTPLSIPDLMTLAAPGVASVTAHGAEGLVSSASLTEQGQVLRKLPPGAAQRSIGWLGKNAHEAVMTELDPLIKRAMISAERATNLAIDARNRLLDAMGVIDHITNVEVPSWMRPVLDRALTRLYGSQTIPEDARVRLDRSAGAVRPDAAMAGISGTHAAIAARRAAGGVRGAGGAGGLGETPSGGTGVERPPPPELSGIDDEKSSWPLEDLFDEAEREIVMDASGIFPPRPPPPPGFVKKFGSIFGSNPDAPWSGRPWMLPWERQVAAPANAARYNIGGVSAQKWSVEHARDIRSEALFSGYRDMLAPFSRLSADEHQKLNAALELLRLEGTEAPLDGSPIVVTNESRALAYHSRPGDRIALDTPRLIDGFIAVRRTMQRIYDDYISALAKRYGWEGEPTSRAILAKSEAEKAFGRPAEARRLSYVAQIVGLAEYSRRNAYVPFMRHGDYFFRVKPKIGTPDKPGVPGWTGEGFPPTIWASRIQSRAGMDVLLGTPRGKSPTIESARAEVRRQFPDSEYTLEEGYLKDEKDELRALGVEGIERLFQAMGRDFRREWRAKIKSSDDPEKTRAAADREAEEQQRAIEVMLKSVYDQLRAGFKHESLNIPGYDPDLSHSIASYTVWLSNHIADLEHRGDIDAANQTVDSSPDRETREFWRSWDHDRDAKRGTLDFGASKLRSAAFYWALGGNFASTIKVMLHGPMLGYPLLSTGLDVGGRAGAGKEYFQTLGNVMKTLRLDSKTGFRLDPASQARTADERTLIAENLQSGRLHASGAEELGFSALRDKGVEALEPRQHTMRRVLRIWGANIAAADQAIRTALLLSAYRMASKPGNMARYNRAWSRGDALWRDADINKEGRSIDSEIAALRNARTLTGSDIGDDRIAELAARRSEVERQMPAKFAEFLVDRAAGIWGAPNRAEFARHPVGGLFYQFRSYELNFLSALHQQLWHMGPEGKLTATMMMGTLTLMAGALGMPFAKDIEDATGFIYKLATQIDANFNERFLEWMGTDPMGLGKDFGKYLLYGVPSEMPHGVDIGPGLSFGDLISRNTRSVIDAIPSLSIFGGSLYHARQRWSSEQPWYASAAEVMPTAIKNLVKAFGVYPREGVVTMRGNVIVPPKEITKEDIGTRAVGLTSGHIGNTYREMERDYQLQQANTARTAALNDRLRGLAREMVFAEGRGDKDAAKAAMDEATKIAAGAGGTARAHAKVFQDAVKAAREPSKARLRHLPKAVRGEAAKPLFTEPGAP